jgi:hypothetical protein
MKLNCWESGLIVPTISSMSISKTKRRRIDIGDGRLRSVDPDGVGIEILPYQVIKRGLAATWEKKGIRGGRE